MDKPKIRVFKVNEWSYNSDVYMVVGDRTSAKAWVKDRFGLEIVLSARGSTWLLRHKHDTVFIYMEGFDTTPQHGAMLAHECFHAVRAIYKSVGVKTNDEEAQAYLLGNLVACCLSLLTNDTKKKERSQK